MKVMTIVGARPQFMKAAPLSQAIRIQHTEILVHTGQHYDDAMSKVFFDELNIPTPDYNLAVGSGPQGEQTAKMLTGLEALILELRPDWVVVLGDTNSTLAGALAASKLKQPLAHIEAGLRSHNRWNMPEEVNRVLTDHVSDLLLTPSAVAVENLSREGLTRNVEVVGDLMVDVLKSSLSRIGGRPALKDGEYVLMTCHRPENTDIASNLANIVSGVNDCPLPVVFPMHPRTRTAIDRAGLKFMEHVKVIEPLGYLDMLTMLRDCTFVITDSGGLVREAYLMKKWCICLRDECEWQELVDSSWCTLTGPNSESIARAIGNPPMLDVTHHQDFYGDGQAARQIVESLERHVNDSRDY